jgi:hypothetical protein
MTYPQANPNVPADRARAMLGHSDRGGQNTSWITSHFEPGTQQAGAHQPAAQVTFTAWLPTERGVTNIRAASARRGLIILRATSAR